MNAIENFGSNVTKIHFSPILWQFAGLFVSLRQYLRESKNRPLIPLQNESVVRDLYVFSDNSYAGSDVTTEKAQGPVIIEKGKVTNRSSNGVFIKNDFEVKLGAEIEIITNP